MTSFRIIKVSNPTPSYRVEKKFLWFFWTMLNPKSTMTGSLDFPVRFSPRWFDSRKKALEEIHNAIGTFHKPITDLAVEYIKVRK